MESELCRRRHGPESPSDPPGLLLCGVLWLFVHPRGRFELPTWQVCLVRTIEPQLEPILFVQASDTAMKQCVNVQKPGYLQYGYGWLSNSSLLHLR
jgi:hypothetical protein